MSLTTGLGYALVRGAAVGTAAVCAGLPVRAVLSTCGGGRGWRARGAWALVLVPFLTPVILVGYAYSGFSLSLIRHPGWNEMLYDALLLMKLVPVAALVLHFAPRSLSPEAVHCRRLLARGRSGGRALLSLLSFRARAEGVPCGAAFAVVFLLAFGEFEMASLMTRPSWTVQLFDAQAGGLVLSESLRLALLPVLVEGAVLGGVLVLLFRGGRTRRSAVDRGADSGSPVARYARYARYAIWGYLAFAALAVSVLPCLVVLGGTVAGLGVLWENFVLGTDIAASVGFALASAILAYLVAGALVRKRALLPAGAALALPGLLGALVLSLIVLAAFQLPGLRVGRETAAPLVLALALVLMPFALLLRALLRRTRPGEALHAAALLATTLPPRRQERHNQGNGTTPAGVAVDVPMVFRRPWRSWRLGGESRFENRARGARSLIWQLSGRRRAWVLFLLFFWAYFDMTASSLLAPVGTTTVFARLYNLMHYGQSQVLSAMVCLSVIVPLVLLACALAARGLVERCFVHG